MLTSNVVFLVKIDNVVGRVITEDPDLMNRLYEKFGIPANNFWFDKRYKAGSWDGKIRFVQRNGQFPNGLLADIVEYLKKQSEFTLEIDDLYKTDFTNKEELKEEFIRITSELDCPFSPRYYQMRAAVKSVYLKRCINEHCTSSGKSLTMALTINFLMKKFPDYKFLVLVPRIDLVEQLSEEFEKYGINKELLGKFTGKIKNIDQKIIVSTWQSIYTETAFLRSFKVFICDECLHPDTLITMHDNSKKKIKDVQIGDMVKTINEKTKKIENKSVKKLHKNINSPINNMFELTMDNGQKIKITGNHKVLLSNSIWKRVDELNNDDDIVDIDKI